MFKKPWFLVSLTLVVVAAIICAVVYFGSVVQPKLDAQKKLDNDLKACEVFIASVKEADKQPSMNLAYNKIFRGANKAIAVYDPNGDSKQLTFGPAYEEFVRMAQLEYQADAMDAKTFFQVVGSEITTISQGCNALKATPTPTPTK